MEMLQGGNKGRVAGKHGAFTSQAGINVNMIQACSKLVGSSRLEKDKLEGRPREDQGSRRHDVSKSDENIMLISAAGTLGTNDMIIRLPQIAKKLFVFTVSVGPHGYAFKCVF
jgi:hypothetical protein